MRRWRVIAAAALFALLGITGPLAATIYVSWSMAAAAQERRLEQIAEQTLSHALSVFADARSALRAASATDLERCSPAHVVRLRELTVNSLATENIGFIRDGAVLCNIWGAPTRRIPRAVADVTLDDGMGMSVNFASVFNPRRPMMVLHLGDYTAMVDQLRFSPPITEPAARTALLSPGGILLATSWETAGAWAQENSDDLILRRDAEGWTVVVRQPRYGFLQHLDLSKSMLAPLVLLLAAMFIALATWLLRRRLSARGELALAVRKREFIAHYQPIIELRTGRCIGAEALVRWRRPDGSLVRPDLFIPLAEDTGLIKPITDQIVDAVISDLGYLLRHDRRLHIAVNLCPADISSGRILPVLENALRGTGVELQQIWVEATERGFVDIEGANHTLAELRRRGHITAIDDFGTGYSGLKYLQQLPVDVLKIDKSFIDAVGTEAPTSNVTEHIIQMARELNLRIVAEGVESERQSAYLRERGVDFAQGWLFSRALPADGFIAFCKANREAYGLPSNVVTLAAE